MPDQHRLIPDPQSDDATPEADARRAEYRERLRQHLQDPQFRQIEGFPIAEDEAILALSDPPYYTACPNPFIPEILATWQAERRRLHAALGLDENAPYHREPFASDVSEGKNDPIYNAHTYHTKVPHKAVMRYILHYTEPGDVVLDGFCGTGMTGVAAQLCGDRKAVEELGYHVDEDGVIYDGDEAISRLGARKAMLVDLSPAATFIAYNYNMPVDLEAFERDAQRILREVEEECGWMYETWHPHCDDPDRVKGRINYTVWSDVFICPECGNEMVFWDAAVVKETGKVSRTFPCPQCQAEHTKRTLQRSQEAMYDSTMGKVLNRAKQVPVLISYSVGKKRHKKTPDIIDLETISRVQEGVIPFWYPITRIDRDIDIWYERDYRSLGIYSVDAFFTKRNLWMLASFWDKADLLSDSRMARAAKFALTGMQVNLSRMNRWRANVSFPYNPLSGTLYVSALQSEANVIVGIRNKVKRLVKAWAKVKESPRINVVLSTQTTASDIKRVEANSVDYIFTDPPFGSNIIYSDLSIIWESWLQSFTYADNETVIHRRKKQKPSKLQDYHQMMVAAFVSMYHVLKPGHWMTVEFHNTQNAVWNVIQEAMLHAGFVVANIRVLDKGEGTFKQVTTTTAVKQDLIISAYKPNNDLEERFRLEAGTPQGAWDFIHYHLGQLPTPALQDSRLDILTERQNYLLYDQMVAFHIQRGASVPLGAAEFYAGLRERFPERDGMFFLPEQAAEYDRRRLQADEIAQLPLIVTDARSARQWVRLQLEEQPRTEGELQPLFMCEAQRAWEKNEEPIELRDLLDSSFVQDEIGRWHVPDPNKEKDLEQLRERALNREFRAYSQGKGRLKVFRKEAVLVGFRHAWRNQQYEIILQVAKRLPQQVLQEDPQLLMYYDNANVKLEETRLFTL